MKTLFLSIKAIIFFGTTLLFTACGPANSTPTPTPKLIPAELLVKWGGEGSGDGQFIRYPFDISIDNSDNIYVTDTNRTQKFNSDGTFISEAVFFEAIDSQNNLYDTDDNYTKKFDSNGTLLLQWGGEGSNEGQFKYPLDVATDSYHNIYVADNNNYRIQKFDRNGTFMLQWGSYGGGEGQFKSTGSIAIDGNDSIYVADEFNYRIQKFDSNGVFLLGWGSELVRGNKDSNNMKFETISDIHVDNLGNVYVVDRTRAIIKKFDTNGNFLSSWNGSTDGKRLSFPYNVATDSNGNVYVVDDYYIWKFKP